MTTIQLKNSAGWTSETLQQLLAFDEPKPVRVDAHELLPNGTFRVAVVTFNTVEDAALFYETAKKALKLLKA